MLHIPKLFLLCFQVTFLSTASFSVALLSDLIWPSPSWVWTDCDGPGIRPRIGEGNTASVLDSEHLESQKRKFRNTFLKVMLWRFWMFCVRMSRYLVWASQKEHLKTKQFLRLCKCYFENQSSFQYFFNLKASKMCIRCITFILCVAGMLSWLQSMLPSKHKPRFVNL